MLAKDIFDNSIENKKSWLNKPEAFFKHHKDVKYKDSQGKEYPASEVRDLLYQERDYVANWSNANDFKWRHDPNSEKQTPPTKSKTSISTEHTGQYHGKRGITLFPSEVESLAFRVASASGPDKIGNEYQANSDDIALLTRVRQLIENEDDLTAKSKHNNIPIGKDKTVPLSYLEDKLLPGMKCDKELQKYVEVEPNEEVNLNKDDYATALDAYNQLPDNEKNVGSLLTGFEKSPPQTRVRPSEGDRLGITTPAEYTGEQTYAYGSAGGGMASKASGMNFKQWYKYMLWQDPKGLSKILKRNITEDERNKVLGEPTYYYLENVTETKNKPNPKKFTGIGRNYIDWNNALSVDVEPYKLSNLKKWGIDTEENRKIVNQAKTGRIITGPNGRHYMWWDDSYGITEIIPPKKVNK